ncbi:hypothetical protein BDP27DRAFT_1339983, partial [Rhodocollybia butyracea]
LPIARCIPWYFCGNFFLVIYHVLSLFYHPPGGSIIFGWDCYIAITQHISFLLMKFVWWISLE